MDTKIRKKSLSKEQRIIKALSDRIVEAQRPIRILDAIKWDQAVKNDFFANHFKKLPPVNKAFYQKYPIGFNIENKIEEFRNIIRDLKQQLGQMHPLGTIMVSMCEEYVMACMMLDTRGTEQFANFATELYGSPNDVFYPGGPKLKDLSSLLGDILIELKEQIETEADIKKYDAKQTVKILTSSLKNFFHKRHLPNVVIDDNIVADAAAGADTIKINSDSMFSDSDLRYLEVHEGWVHVGTTMNGQSQPICTFLSKGSPSSAVTQEGLAVTTEIVTFSSNPRRLQKIVNRLKALAMIDDGADFIEVFNYFQSCGLDENYSYNYSMRLFRGSVPNGKPFTKDLSYTKGFLLTYNYIRLAISHGLLHHIPAMFIGKVLLKDVPILAQYMEEGMITPPRYMPPQFSNLAALGSWMAFSLFLNKLNLDKVAENFRELLR